MTTQTWLEFLAAHQLTCVETITYQEREIRLRLQVPIDPETAVAIDGVVWITAEVEVLLAELIANMRQQVMRAAPATVFACRRVAFLATAAPSQHPRSLCWVGTKAQYEALAASLAALAGGELVAVPSPESGRPAAFYGYDNNYRGMYRGVHLFERPKAEGFTWLYSASVAVEGASSDH